MVNTDIKWITSFAAKDGKTLYSHQKQDQELTVSQIMNSLLSDSDLEIREIREESRESREESRENH